MIGSRKVAFTLGTSVPEAFFLVAASSGAEVVDSWGLNVDDDARNMLAAAIDRVSRVVESAQHPDRLIWILVRTPELGRVDAVLTLDVHSVLDGESIDTLEIALETSPAQEGTIQRKVSRRRVGIGEALVMHDFEQGPDGDGGVRRVTERAYVALFPTPEVLLSYRLMTQDLMLFDDAVDFLFSVASQASVGGEG